MRSLVGCCVCPDPESSLGRCGVSNPPSHRAGAQSLCAWPLASLHASAASSEPRGLSGIAVRPRVASSARAALAARSRLFITVPFTFPLQNFTALSCSFVSSLPFSFSSLVYRILIIFLPIYGISEESRSKCI